ncbi:MAG: DUF309 domain-containing protein [Mycobacterium sp.]
MARRDRDDAGRPQSARPRDALGRPQPYGSSGVPRIADDLDLSPEATVSFAQDLLDEGLAFNAHEVLEAAWKKRGESERTLWQGLAQLAVGITHVQRGNTGGAAKLLRRACGRLADYDGVTHGVDIVAMVDYGHGLAAALDRGERPAGPRLRPRLARP